MFRNRLYYHLKPLLPWTLRTSIRRWFAIRKRAQVGDIWPIKPGTERPPEGWSGWPDNKKFALVLTHDVEGEKGVRNCRNLMALEQRHGFTSSFNFIPESDYETPPALRNELVANGFEVGVHDLKHDGKLYRSRAEFRAHADQINYYLKEWNAVGFRSGLMHHNLEWLHDLNAEYDSSTFDTDPFEPQPDGVDTIFPFWVPGVNGQKGYVELPYTLPQDFSLFLIFRERSIAIWKQKLDWIARHGGMALIDTHPDYMNFNSASSAPNFPSSIYEEFLTYVKTNYSGQFWPALPREVARLTRERHFARLVTSAS